MLDWTGQAVRASALCTALCLGGTAPVPARADMRSLPCRSVFGTALAADPTVAGYLDAPHPLQLLNGDAYFDRFVSFGALYLASDLVAQVRIVASETGGYSGLLNSISFARDATLQPASKITIAVEPSYLSLKHDSLPLLFLRRRASVNTFELTSRNLGVFAVSRDDKLYAGDLRNEAEVAVSARRLDDLCSSPAIGATAPRSTSADAFARMLQSDYNLDDSASHSKYAYMWLRLQDIRSRFGAPRTGAKLCDVDPGPGCLDGPAILQLTRAFFIKQDASPRSVR